MGFTTSNLSLYHTFSKTPVDSNTTSAAAQLGNAINKSGHTVQSNEIWTESIPFFGLAATTTAIHTKFSATAKVNDLVKDSDGKIWQRNSTAYSTSAEFADLWSEKTKSITSFTKGTDGKYTFTEADGALVDGSYLLNSEGVPTVKYYEKRLLTILTADNNANTNSDNKASRLQIDGKWIDQFIGVTDIYVNGSAAVSYAPVLRKTASSSPMQAGPGKGYMDYCATGLILWESSAAGTEVIDCFEYVGTKLDSTVAKLNATVFGSGSEGGEDVSLTQKVAANTAAISVLNGDAQTTGSVAKAVADAEGRVTVTTNALADRIAQLEGIQHFSVVVVPEGETLPATPVENTIYLVKEEGVAEGTYIEYIAYKSGETVVTEKIGSTAIDLSGYTTDEEFATLASQEEGKEGRVTVLEGQVATLTGDAETEGSVAKALADANDYTDTAIATELAEGGSIANAINAAKEQAIANAKVTLTAGNGITIPNSGTQDTAFAISVDTDVIATKQSVDDLSGIVTGVSETVASIQTELSTGSIATGISDAKAAAQAAQTTADEAKATADTAVQSVTRAADSSDLITVTDGTDVTISLSTEVATKTYVGEQASAAQTAAEQTAVGALNDAKTEIKGTTDALAGRLTTAEGKVTVLEGQVAALTTGENSVDSKIQAAVDSITETTDAISEAVEGVKATADTAVQSASGDTYVSAEKEADSTNIKVTTNIDAIASAVDAALVVDGTAVATAIAAAATAGTDAAAALADTAITEQSVSGSGISVTLGGKVGIPTLTGSVTTASYADGVWTDGEKVATGSTVAAAIKDVDDKINTLHSTAVTYKVFETKPEASEELKGIIALVPAGEGDSAVAGSYIEWLCVESVAEDGSKSYSWERIGTTAADFTQYAKTADLKVDETTVNGLTYSQTNGLVSASVAKASTTQVGTVQLTDTYSSTDSTNAATGTAIAAAIATLDTTAPVGEGAVKVSQTDGIVSSVTVETEALVSEGAIIDGTTSPTALVTAADALEAIKLAKPENYVASVTGYTEKGAEVTTTQGAAVKVLDGRGTSVTADDLWGTKATLDSDGNLAITHDWITNPNGSSAWNSSITKVEDNKAYVGEAGDTFYANIQTERIKDGSYMFLDCTNLTSFSSDLSNLTNGYNMFYNTNLSQFSSDLPVLRNGEGMFFNTSLTSFTSDLSNLTNGKFMFNQCTNLTSFSSDLSSLTNGYNMFSGCTQLESFSSDLSSLTNGYNMFYNTNLSQFSSDLPSLTNGESMFNQCTNLTSFSSDLSSLTNGTRMFMDCLNLTTFCGDLSSLTNGYNMFIRCKLDTESVEIIADTINTVTAARIDIKIGNTTPNDEEDAAFKQMQDKGWSVYVNGSDTEYVPRTGEASLNETGEIAVAPKPYWAKPIEVTEDKAEYVGQDGKFYQVVGGQFIYVNDPETYGMFVSLEDAVANMRLTKYEKPVEEA